jgi:hypothetical protein
LAAEMQNRLIEWYQEDQFASANLNRVDLFEIKGKRSLVPKSSYELPSQVSCISCNASRGVVAVGQQSGNISFLQSETTSGVRQFIRKDSATIYWIRVTTNHLTYFLSYSRSLFMIRVLPVGHAQLYLGTNKIPISLLLDLRNLEGERRLFSQAEQSLHKQLLHRSYSYIYQCTKLHGIPFLIPFHTCILQSRRVLCNRLGRRGRHWADR